MRSLSLQQTAFAGLGLAALLVLSLMTLSWQLNRQTLAAANFVAHTHEVLSGLSTAESSLYRAEADHRAFLAVARPRLADQRDEAVGMLRAQLGEVARLTQDNPAQQRRLQALLQAVDQRMAAYRRASDPAQGAGKPAAAQRMEDGVTVLADIAPLFRALNAEEQRLLNLRETEERDRTAASRRTFTVLGVVLTLLLPAIFWRVRADAVARGRAEAEVATERRYDTLHARALTLFNAKGDRQEVLNATLALLAQDGDFPVSAFYGQEQWGRLSLVASLSTPADVQRIVSFDEGMVGSVAREMVPRVLTGLHDTNGWHVETGLARVRPAALLINPVAYQGQLLGVLVLASGHAPAERDRDYVERLCAQLAVALHNLRQMEGLALMAEQLRERGMDIERKNEQLERATRMKSEFVANMSHELRTPLNAVIGFSEILRDGLAGDLSDRQKEFIGDIHTSGQHLLSLINDVLDLSKVEAGQMTLEYGPLRLSELATSGLSVVRDKAAQRNVRLHQAVEPGLDAVWVDPRRTKQIVFNLLSNAVKFTPDGGTVSLHLRRVARERLSLVQVEAHRRVFLPLLLTHETYVEISVTDTGIGISNDGLRELFQPFVQIDSSLSRKYEGTGLGLTMTQRLAELHDGGLMVDSTPGIGSTFTVWLPWRTAVEAAAMPPSPETLTAADSLPVGASPASTGSLQTPLVLLVEDDPRTAQVLRLQLEGEGFRVEVAPSGESGLALAAMLRPDAMVLDILLPGMDGWDMLAQLKEQPATQDIPVVIVSVTDELRRGFALGASQVLVKPVSQEELLSALGAVGLMPGRERPHVLVVDDDPKAVTLVCTHLRAAGLEPETAYGGQEALDRVRRKRPDLVVLDLMMPQVSGFDVLDALSREPDTAGIAVLVLTAKVVTSEDRANLRGRVQRVVEKADFEPALLVGEIKRAMAKRRRAVMGEGAATVIPE